MPFKLQGIRRNFAFQTETHCTNKHMKNMHMHYPKIFIK